MRVRRSVAAVSLLVIAGSSLSACTFGSSSGSSDAGAAEGTSAASGSASAPVSSPAPVDPVSVKSNTSGTDVPVDKVVTVSAANGAISSVALTSKAGKVKGTIKGSTWTADSLLEPGTTYTLKTTATDDSGKASTTSQSFTTKALTLDEQTYPSVAPLQGETVGVGMPVIVHFDVAVTDKKSIEKHLKVTSMPAQAGSWHWMNDNEVHWRPKTYWKSGTKVTVDADINSVPAGNGIYGQEDRHVSFEIGSANIYKVNTQTDQMGVYSNGKLLRTIPITTGEQPDFTTRSGVKVIMEKFASKEMNSETIGIDPNSPDGYDLDNVQYAMRVTSSGEFIHAAPWSVSSQGVANVSHGCTGMSTENAEWLYAMSKRGDVVEYTGTDRPMTLDNGYGDWNASFKDYEQGSALHKG